MRTRAFALAVTLLVIATATLTPGTQGLRPAVDISRRLSRFLRAAGIPTQIGPLGFDFLANVAMFFPLGFFLGLLLWNRWNAWLFTLPPLTSLAIETFQHLFLPSRGPQFEDVIANTVGGWLGLLFFLLLWWAVHRVQSRNAVKERGGHEREARGRGEAVPQAQGWASAAIDVVSWGAAIALTSLLFLSIGGVRISHRREFCLWLLVAVLQLAVGLLLGVYRFGKRTMRGRSPLSRQPMSRLETFTSLAVATLGVGTIAWLLTLFWGPTFYIPRSLMLVATPIALLTGLSARFAQEAISAIEEEPPSKG